jgi:hypothetical protein
MMFRVLLEVMRQDPPLKMLDRASIRGQLVSFELQADSLLTLHKDALGDLTGDRPEDKEETVDCRLRKRVQEMMYLDAGFKSLLLLVRELLAVLQD